MKKVLSAVLVVLIMIGSMTVGFYGLAAAKQPNGSQHFLSVDAAPAADAYQWGDTLTFSVDVTNNTRSRIKDIQINARTFNALLFTAVDPDVLSIDALEPGETETISFDFRSIVPNNLQKYVVIPFLALLNVFVPFAFQRDGYDKVIQTKVGYFKYGFGFTVINETVDDDNPPVVPPEGSFAVSFNLNYAGSTGTIPTQYVQAGEKATEPAAPTRERYVFVGWYTDASCEEEFRYNFDTAVTSNLVLYAKWQIGEGFIDDVLDDVGPDVEIYSFSADTFDILIGETKTVTFTSEIFSNIELADGAVTVVDEDNQVIGTMNDKGVDGDVTANDGIFTLKAPVISESVCTRAFYSTVDDLSSNKCIISFYRHYTTEDYDNYAYVLNRIKAAASPYLDESGYVFEGQESNALNTIKAVLEQQIREGRVLSYRCYDCSAEIMLVGNFPFEYVLMQKDLKSGAGSCQIATYQSFWPEWMSPSLNTTDGSAQHIADTFEEYVFSSNLDNESVTLSAMKELSKNSVIIIDTHGGYSLEYGSHIALGELQTTSQTEAYEADISAGRINLVTVEGKDDVYSISGGFISKYCGNMDGALVFLSACQSGKDMLDNRRNTYELAQAFIDKGAVAVLGTSATASVGYVSGFSEALFERLTESEDAGNSCTLSEAFSYAISQVGATDSNGARFEIFPLNNSAAQNYRLHNTTGSISGVIKNASNNSVVSNALVRIYQNDELVASVRTDSNGAYSVSLPAGSYIVQINAGGYKTAKTLVTVVSGRVTYLETFLLLYAGVTSGFANGKTINAITGERLQTVTIKIRRNWNNKTGAVLATITSNDNGYYEVRTSAGLYTLECTKDGYVTTYKNIVVSPVDIGAQDISISPVLQEGDYRVVLTWGEHPNDLDSHLFGHLSDGAEYHVYYRYKDGYNAGGTRVANLDVDDTTSYGPETTTFSTDANSSL